MNEITDIKTAICLFFSASGEALEIKSDEIITRFISYFDYAAAKAELLSYGFLVSQNGNIKITDKGQKWAENLGGSLKSDIREQLLSEAQRLKTETETAKICRTKIEGGENFFITAEIGDETLPVMTIKLYAPDEKNAEKIEAAIKRDPFGVYKSFMKIIEKP
jgi:hypothetical protein